MAGSRLEKIGTIFTRNSGLLQSTALKWEDRPLWYDVYATFLPLDIPKIKRPELNIKLRHIFYEEDKVRSTIRENKYSYDKNFLGNEGSYKSLIQKYIDGYKKLSA